MMLLVVMYVFRLLGGLVPYNAEIKKCEKSLQIDWNLYARS